MSTRQSNARHRSRPYTMRLFLVESRAHALPLWERMAKLPLWERIDGQQRGCRQVGMLQRSRVDLQRAFPGRQRRDGFVVHRGLSTKSAACGSEMQRKHFELTTSVAVL